VGGRAVGVEKIRAGRQAEVRREAMIVVHAIRGFIIISGSCERVPVL
jgi:hypothetical protein